MDAALGRDRFTKKNNLNYEDWEICLYPNNMLAFHCTTSIYIFRKLEIEKTEKISNINLTTRINPVEQE